MKYIHPINAQGMPVPGKDFMAAAAALGDDKTQCKTKGKNQTVISLTEVGPELEQLVHQALYGRGSLQLSLTVADDKRRSVAIVSGHRWGAHTKDDKSSMGPEPCDVMVVGKLLSAADAVNRRFLSDGAGQELINTLEQLGIKGYRHWYVTGVLKTENLEGSAATIKQRWIADQLFLLQQEIRLVKPKYILMLGSEPVKVFCGKNATLGSLAGQVIDLEFDMRKELDDTTPPLKCKAMGCMHPSAIVHKPDQAPQFLESLRRFASLIEGNDPSAVESVDHRVIETEEQLLELCSEINRTTTNKIIAMDAEWHGDHPENANAYLRTVQLSWAHGKAAAIKLRGPGGTPVFAQYVRDAKGRIPIGIRPFGLGQKPVTTEGGIARAMKILTEFMQDKRACGHYFVADLEWLIPEGLDLRKQFAAPERWEDAPTKGGLDTALMAHALEETGDFSLTGQFLAHTTAPRYDAPLGKWKKEYCRARNMNVTELEGYGDCPDDILIPYGNYDADVTYRLCMKHMKSLDSDAYGNNCWKPFWLSQRAALAVLEISRTGLVLDKARVDDLTSTYMDVRTTLEENIRRWAHWPDLNLSSVYKVRELLFGRKYNGKNKVDGVRPRLRPKSARTIGAIPLVATGKPPKQWADVVAEGKEDTTSPSVNGLTLGILWFKSKELDVIRNGKLVQRDMSKVIGWLRNYRFISQILKSVLRTPVYADDETTGDMDYQRDDDNNFVYDAGLSGVVCGDGRIRTTIYQTKETGRWSSARPPLQNISARREPDYARILGDKYTTPLRSVLTAPPGWCLVEADYIGAELFIAAIMAGDPDMLDHVTRNKLPEDDPNFYDIHSNVCVSAFSLNCAPTKKGLESINQGHLRIVAKAVIFGLMYGRGAKAIALASQEEGIIVTQDDAQRIIDAIYKMYSRLEPFFASCRWRVSRPTEREIALLREENQDYQHVEPARWICGPFGRYRRFPLAREKKQYGEFERQAQNFPVQGGVADAISIAIANLYDYREKAYANGTTKDELDYSICLQVHDALIVMAPAKHVPALVDTILPKCMCADVPVYPTDMDGKRLGTGPYYFGIDIKVAQAWGTKMNPDNCLTIGLDPSYAGWVKHELGYCKSGDTTKVWIPYRGFVKL